MGIANKANSRFKRLGQALFGGRPWRVQDLFYRTGSQSAGHVSDANPALRKLFTTAAGSTNSLLPGDPVGRIERLAGSFNFTQSTSGLRGTLGRFPAVGIFNLFTTATATLTTRNFTTTAVQYTLSFKGTGTVTLSGTSTAGPLVGTGVNDRVSLTFTPTAGTLTLTVAGSCTEGQIVFGASPLDYQDVIAADNITQSGIPDLYLPYFNGSQWMTAGTGTFGTASLFADAGQSWTVWGVFRTTSAGTQNIVARCSGGSATIRTFQYTVELGLLNFRIRGTSNTIGSPRYDDGQFHVWAMRWNGTAIDFRIDSTTHPVNVGAATEEAENITLGIRTESGPNGFFTGHNAAAMVDYALSDAQMTQLMASLNSTYRQGL